MVREADGYSCLSSCCKADRLLEAINSVGYVTAHRQCQQQPRSPYGILLSHNDIFRLSVHRLYSTYRNAGKRYHPASGLILGICVQTQRFESEARLWMTWAFTPLLCVKYIIPKIKMLTGRTRVRCSATVSIVFERKSALMNMLGVMDWD